jgi:2-C-methyl-D-erythritol 4-phosphate cytidylyltransferase
VLAWSIAAARAAQCFDEIVVVAPKEKVAAFAKVAGERARVIAGGDTRTASSWAALDALASAEVIAIHDAARPFAPPSLYARCIEIAAADGSAVAGLPLADTVRRADEAGAATEELSREGLWSAQTPQAFRRELLAQARAAAGDRSYSDDAAAVAAAGAKPKMVLGERRNLKITTLEDLAYARELVAKGLVGFPALSVR